MKLILVYRYENGVVARRRFVVKTDDGVGVYTITYGEDGLPIGADHDYHVPVRSRGELPSWGILNTNCEFCPETDGLARCDGGFTGLTLDHTAAFAHAKSMIPRRQD
jgi:hypothetical protein